MNLLKHSPPIMPALKLSAALLALFTFPSVQAATFCVGTADELSAALLGAQASGESHTILVQQGNYVMRKDIDVVFGAPTTLSGGYSAQCSQQVFAATSTVIDIGSTHAFNLKQLNGVPEARISIEGLTLRNAGRFGMRFQAGDGSTNAIGRLDFSRVRFTDIASADAAPLALYAYGGGIDLQNVLIDHLSTYNASSVDIHADGGAPITINHLTADLGVGGASSPSFALSDGQTPTRISIYNSIIWNSDGGQSPINATLAATSKINLVNNLYHSNNLLSGIVNEKNSIHAAPGWVDAAVGNYRLQTHPQSPAINSGTLTSAGGEPKLELGGGKRLIDNVPDRGAFESAFLGSLTFTVTNKLDSGAGSLRDAITQANASPSPPIVINFNIPGACPAVIALNSVLPNIITPITINGQTQPGSTLNSDPFAFNATLCVLLKPAAGTLGKAFEVPIKSPGRLTLRGFGIGGFGQPIRLMGGQGSVIAGNQFGGSAGGVALPGAGLNAITIGPSSSDTLIGGANGQEERNAIGGAGTSGILNETNLLGTSASCQIFNNLIGLARDGFTPLPNTFGINNSGSGCLIQYNRIAGNIGTNLWLNAGSNNIVQNNFIGITTQNLGVDNNASGILVTGSNNIIGAQSNLSSGGNTIRFNNAGGVVIRGGATTGNSIKANIMYENGFDGFIGERMDIDLQVTSLTVGPNANDMGDVDTGPNQLQNFPIGTSLVYTDAGTGPGMLDRGAIVSASLDGLAGASRIDAYYSSAPGALDPPQRGRAEVFLGTRAVLNFNGGVITFTMPVTIPNQNPGGLVSFTATDAAGNTSEIGTGLSILPDALFANGLEN